MCRMRGRPSSLFLASFLIAANSLAKDGDRSGHADDHSVTLPPQPEPPPGLESEAPPVELDGLPPPPAPPPGARKRARKSRAPARTQAPEREWKPNYQREIAPALPEKDTRSGKWYGVQTLTFDGASLAFLALGISEQESFPAGAGAIGFLIATPIVHAVHRKGGRAWGSLGLRVALPTGGAIVSGENPLIGALVGAMGASFIDALRAYDDPKPAAMPRRQTMLVSPIVGRKGCGLSFGGSF
jgi:hypothetical protein